MKPLQPPDSHHLQAAIGWLELGNYTEANEELEKITPGLRSHPDVLSVRWQIYAKDGKWGTAAEIAHALNRIRPLEPQFWIWRAYATRRMPGGGIPQAKEVLDKAQPLFSKEPLIAYNLAFHECQIGNQKEACAWLKKALDLGDPKSLKSMALEDPDLEPLRAEIGEI